MSDFLKHGWHPKGKDGGKESWRGDFKGVDQVAGWMGKGKRSGDSSATSTHVSRPLATLKDPTLFGPPPKNVNYHGGAALPNEITPQTGGIGAPLSQADIEEARRANTPVYEEPQQIKSPPPLPFRADRTGLSTDNLPAPPVRRNLMENTAPSPRPSPSLPPRLPSRQNSSPVPANPTPVAHAQDTVPVASPPPTLNQSAMSRLGNAGVSIPAFGIGRNNTTQKESNPWQEEKSKNASNSVSELSSRFARMRSPANDNSTATPTNTQTDQDSAQPQTKPPSWQDAQSSLKTAQNFHKDPSTVTLADAQQAATTAKSAHTSAVAFRAKHSDKFDAAEKKATVMNKKYNVTGRLNKFLEDANDQHDQIQQQQQAQQQQPPIATATTTTTATQAPYQRPSPSIPTQSQPQPTDTSTPTPQPTQPKIAGRKPPPPPPPKKPANMHGNPAYTHNPSNSNGNGTAAAAAAAAAAATGPPPVPLGTRPSFT